MKRICSILFFVTAVLFAAKGQSEVSLSPVKLYNGKLEMLLPDSFKLMATESIRQLKPGDPWPNFVYMNNSRSISIELMYTEQSVFDDIIPVIKDAMKDAYGEKYPSAVWKDEGVIEPNNKKVGYFELVTKSGNADIYNMMFFAEIDSKLFSCSILFPLDFYDNWIAIGRNIMKSVKELE